MSESGYENVPDLSGHGQMSCSENDLSRSESIKTIRPKHILIGVTGSVASVKLPLLVRTLFALNQQDEMGVEIRIVATKPALHFFKREECRPAEVLTDEDEWKAWKRMADPVLHIDLRNWADVMLVAPLDANTLAKLANGVSDNFLTCVLRAWDLRRPVLICPAMNTYMWKHPFTTKHLAILTKELGYRVIPPITKNLACGDHGVGGMATVDDIARIVMETVNENAP